MKSIKNTLKEYSYFFILVSTILIVLLGYPTSPFNKAGYMCDDAAVFRLAGTYIQQGKFPYLDMFDHKGPYVYLINYLMVLMNPLGGYIVDAAHILASLFFMIKISKLFSSDKLTNSIVALIAFLSMIKLDFSGMIELFALPYIAAAVFIFMDYYLNGNINKPRLLTYGLSFGVVLMIKPNITIVWLFTCITVLIVNIKNKTIKNVYSFVLWFLLGALLSTTPFLLWVYRHGAFSEFVYDYIIFNFTYTDNGNIFTRILTAIALPAENIIVVAAACSIFYLRRKKLTPKGMWLSILFIIIVDLFISISGRIYPHYAIVLIPLAVAPVSAGITRIEVDCQNIKEYLHLVKKILLAIIIGISLADSVVFATTFIKDQTYLSYTGFKETVEFVKENTDADDKILVIGNMSNLYLQTGRMPATKYPFQLPPMYIDQNLLDDFISQLRDERPPMIIFDNYWYSIAMNELKPSELFDKQQEVLSFFKAVRELMDEIGYELIYVTENISSQNKALSEYKRFYIYQLN